MSFEDMKLAFISGIPVRYDEATWKIYELNELIGYACLARDVVNGSPVGQRIAMVYPEELVFS